MKSGIAIVAGLFAGVLVALGVLAAVLFVGPDPVALRPTPSAIPSIAAPPSSSAAPVSSASASPSASGSPVPSSGGSGSPGPSGSGGGSTAAGGSPTGSGGSQTGFLVRDPAAAIPEDQLRDGTIDLANLSGPGTREANALPSHFWIVSGGIVSAGAFGPIGCDGPPRTRARSCRA